MLKLNKLEFITVSFSMVLLLVGFSAVRAMEKNESADEYSEYAQDKKRIEKIEEELVGEVGTSNRWDQILDQLDRVVGGEEYLTPTVIRWALIHGAPLSKCIVNKGAQTFFQKAVKVFKASLLQAIVDHKEASSLDAIQNLKEKASLTSQELALIRTAYLLAIGRRMPSIAETLWKILSLNSPHLANQMLYQGLTIAALTDQGQMVDNILLLFNPFDQLNQKRLLRTLDRAIRFAIGQLNFDALRRLITYAEVYNLPIDWAAAESQALTLRQREEQFASQRGYFPRKVVLDIAEFIDHHAIQNLFGEHTVQHIFGDESRLPVELMANIARYINLNQ